MRERGIMVAMVREKERNIEPLEGVKVYPDTMTAVE